MQYHLPVTFDFVPLGLNQVRFHHRLYWGCDVSVCGCYQSHKYVDCTSRRQTQSLHPMAFRTTFAPSYRCPLDQQGAYYESFHKVFRPTNFRPNSERPNPTYTVADIQDALRRSKPFTPHGK